MNNLINQSKMLKVLSENAIDQSIDFLKDNESNDSLESEMDSYTSQISNYANSNGGVMATSIAKGLFYSLQQKIRRVGFEPTHRNYIAT